MRNPRINVVVSPEQHSLLMELGALQGRSASSFIREMLDAAEPMLAAQLPLWRAVVEQAQAQPEILRKAIHQSLLDLQSNVDQLDLLKLLVQHQPAISNDDGGEERTERSEGAPQLRRDNPGR